MSTGAPEQRSGGVDPAVRGRPEASDHAPVWIELGPKKKSKSVRRTRKARR